MKYEFKYLEMRFYKRQVSFMAVKTVNRCQNHATYTLLLTILNALLYAFVFVCYVATKNKLET